LLTVKLLQFTLWVIKDNAAHFQQGWIVAPMPARTVVNTNTWASRPSCADGTFEGVRFGAAEMQAARLRTRIPMLHMGSTPAPSEARAKLGANSVASKATATMLTSGSLRYQRFQYFIDIARSSVDVAMKIAQYCSGLEALVSTAQTELSHQVSERVAVTLSLPGERRITLFKLVKEAYGFRSKAVHGASFKPNDAERLRKCARQIDEVCRALVVAYFSPESGFRAAIEGNDESIANFFIRRTLGDSAEVAARGGGDEHT
jgi:hypothetical protein